MPEPGEGEVLIHVNRAGVNYADTHARRELLPRARTRRRSRPAARSRASPRTAAAWSRSPRPAATRSTSRYRRPSAIPIPDDVSDGQALALLIQGLTAWHLYKTSARLAEGESVVVHAAAGGVGSLAVQLGKAFGAGARDRAPRRARRSARWRSSSAPTTPSTHARRPRRRAARGQRRRPRRHRAGDGRRRRVRRVAEGARPVRAARHLRQRVARAEPVATGALMHGSRAVIGFWLVALLPRSRPDDRRAAAGPVRPRGVRLAARGRGARLPAVRGASRARGPTGPADHGQAGSGPRVTKLHRGHDDLCRPRAVRGSPRRTQGCGLRIAQPDPGAGDPGAARGP